MSPDIKKSILVVDDDPYVLESASTLLSEYEYNVLSCNCGGDALKELLKKEFKLNIWLENDSNAVVLAEKRLGKYRKYKNLI